LDWITLNKESQLDFLIQQSHSKPQIVFKHSTTCPISSMAKNRLDRSEGHLADYAVYYLDLLSYRSISNEIAARLAVHHESPQVIIVYKGEVSYDESHLDISVEDILEHFKYLQN